MGIERKKVNWVLDADIRGSGSASTDSGGPFWVAAVSALDKSWKLLTPVFERWIPDPAVLHPYPDARFHAIHPSEEPYA